MPAPASPVTVEILADQQAAVNGRAIPDDQQFAGELPLQMIKKRDDLRALDRGIKPSH